MTTENTQETNQEIEVSPTQQSALEKGWRPKEEWEGDPDKWVDAREFLLREEIFEQLHSVKRKNKELERTLNEFKGHHERVKETEFKRALEVLKAEKKHALENADADRVVEIDEEMANVRAKAAQEAAKPAQLPQEFVEWVDKNPWYQVNPRLKQEADQIGFEYAKANPTKAPSDVFEFVETEIKKRHQEIFKITNPNKTRASAVDSGGKTTPTKASAADSGFELTDDERRSMERFVRQGILTKEQYMSEIKKTRGQ